jgi:hypothetical protein
MVEIVGGGKGAKLALTRKAYRRPSCIRVHRPRRVAHLSNLLRSRHRSIETGPEASTEKRSFEAAKSPRIPLTLSIDCSETGSGRLLTGGLSIKRMANR